MSISIPEDKLSHDERRRLESLAQACSLYAMKPVPSAESVLEYARRFDRWIEKGQVGE